MINLLGKIPDTICVAVSGGSDSMAALDFLTKKSWRKVVALHFNHGTDHADEAERFVKNYCLKRSIPLATGKLSREIEKGESKEAFWREQRYSFFENWSLSEHSLFLRKCWSNIQNGWEKIPIVTCHHLDDVVETWIFTSLHGKSRLIPYKRDNFIRPFLLTKKDKLSEWCSRNSVPYITDPSNKDTIYMRNLIRHKIVPEALAVNPGLHKVLFKKIEASHEEIGFII